MLPLVPGYLSYVAGTQRDGRARTSNGAWSAGAVLFVIGFTVIFVAEGLLFGSLGRPSGSTPVLIERILGVVTIVMGLVFLGRFSFLQREARIHRLPARASIGAPLLGAAFGLAWAPCLTPTLSAVFALAYHAGHRGARRVPHDRSTVSGWASPSCWSPLGLGGCQARSVSCGGIDS